MPLPAGLVLEPLPVGAWAFLAVTVAVATKTLTFASAFSAFTNDVIWLIVVSFFFARVGGRALSSLFLKGRQCCQNCKTRPVSDML